MLFVVLIFVVVRVTSASAIAHSTYPAVGGKSVDLGVPVSDVSHSNQSVSSSDDKKIDDIEERGQTSQMLGFIKGLTTRYMYSKYAKKVRQYGSLEEALKSDKMEALYNLCIKHNRKNKSKNQLSAVTPLLEAYGRDDMPNKLRNVLENEGYNKLMIKHLLRETWLIERMSIDEVFDLLQFGDDLTIAIQTGKFDDLKEYILLLVRIKYNDKVSEYVDDELVKILTSRFGGDGNFVEQMSKARFSRVNDESVSGLESALFRKWNRLTKKEVWAQLQFSDDPVKSLTSSKMKIADKYFTEKDFYCRFTANDLFENDFGQEVVTVAFAIAKLEPATKEFVTMMQYKHIKYWLNKTLTAGIIFGNLKFNMDAIDIFFDLKIGTLSYFISLMNPTQPYIRSGNVWDLARLAMKAMNRDDPAQLLKYDTSLLEVLFAKWRSEYIKPTNLYEQIHGGEITDDDDETDKSIVREYADFCEPEHEISIPSFTVPRRS